MMGYFFLPLAIHFQGIALRQMNQLKDLTHALPVDIN